MEAYKSLIVRIIMVGKYNKNLNFLFNIITTRTNECTHFY